ncbi:MAG: helix-turn-helix domain-containing protein [Acidobacteria bacterium]|nr:helix-turn-helix domain-containing protein [Acidobacteriota bacterium]
MNALHYSPTRFPAPVVRARAAGSFVLSETRYAAGAELATHAHEYACLVVVLGGTFRERCDGSTREVEPGAVIVRPEGEPHSDRFTDGGGRCLNVELPPQWLARVRELVRPLDTSGVYRGSAFAVAGRRLHTELTRGDDVSALAVEALVLGLFADAARTERRLEQRAPRWLSGVRARIHEDPVAHLSLAELASAAGVHPVHLAAAFRRHYGASVAAYVRQLRIDFACRELAASDAPLADIALAAGFADQSHFGRTFKEAMHVTPAAYRAAVRRR